MKKFYIIASITFLFTLNVLSQFIPVGSGSYTTTFPGTDAAARNSYPSGTPQISGNAMGKPVPTNDWWSSLIKSDHVSNIFNYPLALRTVNGGLVVSYIVPGSGPNGSSQPMDDVLPITVGVTGLNATKATASDYSDWTVTASWNDGSHEFYSTIGLAMPFIYFTKKSSDVAQITVTQGTVVINNEMLVITDARNGSDFAVYAPSGSTWLKNGSVYTSTLNNKDYWSIAFIPPSASNITTVANEYKKYAYVFPAKTQVSWEFDETSSVMSSTFTVTTDVKEGTDTKMLMGLLPHQWAHLANFSDVQSGYTYPSIRGEIKTLEGNSFTVQNTFHGILPTLPYLDNYSQGFSPADMSDKISMIENDKLASWTDSYNEGQVMNRLIQTARIADLMGNTEARDKMLSTIKERLEDWLKAEAGEVAFLFYYNSAWSALLGYPAGHGQDSNLNDHHFHWGYFVHAAAFVEQYSPGWADKWGPMINLLIRDAASPDRNDTKFPFLRSFSPYAGHCWANGFATFPFGNDQESTSESMQFNSSLIHWGTLTGNKEIRDLGIYLYTTEQTAIEEYWLDKNHRNFKPGYGFSIVSRIWGNGYDNQTFWTSDIAAAYGIEMYPFHGGSLYLGQDTVYVKKLWDEISVNTGILTNQANDNLWHDVMWEYLAFIDPAKAVTMYNSYPERSLKFGISDAQTYHWLHSMNALGRVDATITADYPLAAAFTQKGVTTYVAHNYSNVPIIVNFSDGYSLDVPANKMATSRDIEISGIISSDFPQAYPGGSVNLQVTVDGESCTKVDFYDGNSLIGSKSESPYIFKAVNLNAGIHKFFAKVYVNDRFNVSNTVKVQVGEQVPYSGTPASVPGTIEAGLYDKFEGGVGQGISYYDSSPLNEGDFREDEYVDAGYSTAEGATVGWISAGEWLEYTIYAAQAGLYDLNLRYSSGNANGGGPFHLEIDGKPAGSAITIPGSGSWETWKPKTVNNIPIPSGKHKLRVVFDNEGFNLGKLTFSYAAPLGYNQPVANAGSNIKVLLPANTAILDGSQTTNPDNKDLSYSWTQVYGPSIIIFSDNTAISPEISNLESGIYLCRLSVSDGTYDSYAEVKIIVTDQENLDPYVSITSPVSNAVYSQTKPVNISAIASDLDGTISLVEFYDGDNKIAEATTSPYNYSWINPSVGSHSLTAKATDSGGAVTVSSAVSITVVPAPSCSGGPASGDYTYRFTTDKSNPYLTFVPKNATTGTPTCILYYSTSASGPFPGINVKPNVPQRITAAEGTTIYFYYTYSYAGMEKNTAADKHTYEIGSCIGSDPYLTVLVTNLSVAAALNSKVTFTIDTNVDCNISSSQPWLSISSTTVNKYTTITLTAEANPTAALRSSTISVSSEGLPTKTITVNQAAGATSVNNEAAEEISVFPNPATDRIYISGIKSEATATFYDVCGNQIFAAKLYKKTSEIPLDEIKRGVYFVRIISDNEVTVKQFVRQ